MFTAKLPKFVLKLKELNLNFGKNGRKFQLNLASKSSSLPRHPNDFSYILSQNSARAGRKAVCCWQKILPAADRSRILLVRDFSQNLILPDSAAGVADKRLKKNLN